MKLNICYNDKGNIDNFNNVRISDNLDLSAITNSSCNDILVLDSLDYVSYENVKKTLLQIIQKLRLNGKITIVGTDLRSLNRLTLSEHIDIETFNQIISNIKSLNTEINIRNILLSLGLVIESSIINHYKYEIIATRNSV